MDGLSKSALNGARRAIFGKLALMHDEWKTGKADKGFFAFLFTSLISLIPRAVSRARSWPSELITVVVVAVRFRRPRRCTWHHERRGHRRGKTRRPS